MSFDPSEWLNIVLRWTHVFAAIMWVGQTYFFTWLDGRFTELERAANGGAKENGLWMVHSGGFYLVQKQSFPRLMAQKLHWFKWEAMMTWISGIGLLTLVYYAGGMLSDARYDQATSIAIGLGFIVVGWLVYDLLWSTLFSSNEQLGVVVSFLLSVLMIYSLSQFFGGRTAYIHAGAVFGSIMTANVWIRIIPAQKKMVAALLEGKKPDLTLGAKAKTRSKHNTFLVVPVVFMMISNHYPTVSYGSDYGWVLLSALVLVGWGAAKFLRKA